LPGQSHTAIWMHYWQDYGTQTLVQTDRLFVYDYNKQPGNNFQVYYKEQRADVMLPQTTYNSDGSLRLSGSPVSGLTNQQNWDQYGIAWAGAVAPATASTLPDIDGLVQPFSTAPDAVPPSAPT